MEHPRREIKTLVIVLFVFLALGYLATGGVTWAAPPSQGCTVPPCVPPPPPIPIPVTGGGCCLPGIAFSTNRDGNEEIYVMKSDGSGALRLTNHPGVDRHPAPSPDGKRIAFSSNRDDPDPVNCGKAGKPNCVFNIYVMNVDGSEVKRLTTGPGQDASPAWSNDGTHIAFVSTFEEPNLKTCGQAGVAACVTQIYVMGADGYWINRVSGAGSNFAPNWSPVPMANQVLAFVSNKDGNDEVYVENIAFTYDRDLNEKLEASGITRLTNNPAADGHPAWSPDGTQLVFESNRDGHYQLYVMRADGTGTTRITNTDSVGTLVSTKALPEDRYPIWIPSCSERIVFSSNRTGDFRIYSVDPDGKNPSQLTVPAPNATQVDLHPAWSGLPEKLQVLDGACCVPGIAFDSLRDGIEEIYVMKGDGQRLTPLTVPSVQPGRNMRPAPSRDGTKIAFQSNRDGRFQLYWMPIGGGPAGRLTNNTGEDTNPMWSNNGKQIAFASTRDGGNSKIYVMDVDVTTKVVGEKRVTSDVSRTDDGPAWSPTGDLITFQSKASGGNEDIFVVKPDGTGLTQLTNDPATDAYPSVSPDGLLIAFESNRTGKFQIFTMKIDGSGVKQITTEGENRHPYWCPSCTDRIVFSSDRKGDGFRIYTMNGDGSTQVRLTVLDGGLSKPDDYPAWSGMPLPAILPVIPVKSSP